MESRDGTQTAFKALLVGNAHFPEDPFGLGDLKGPLNDVDTLCGELSNPDTGLFQCQAPLKDARAEVMRDTIGEFFAAANRNDCLLFYYSGHGRIDLGGGFYLCGYDTNTDKIHTPKISGSELAAFVEHSAARTKIIILDCCYANEFKGVVWSPKHFMGKGRFVLAAARQGSPLVPDASAADQLSPFTERLIDALRSDVLDVDGDGFVTVNEVADYITEWAARTPDAPFALQNWTGTGFVPIARSRRSLRATAILVDQPSPSPRQSPEVIEFPVSVPPTQWPELIPVPPDGPTMVYLGKHLVTNGQFRAFLRDPANAHLRPMSARAAGEHVDYNYLRGWTDVTFPAGLDNYPVVNVSAEAARAYASWAGRHLGRPLRLLTTEEWGMAARVGRSGDWLHADIAAGQVNFRGTGARLAEVGEFGPNAYGICDLLGNVWDLCLDAEGSPNLRGGAFDTPESRLLECLTLRSPIQCREDVGFRCASDTL